MVNAMKMRSCRRVSFIILSITIFLSAVVIYEEYPAEEFKALVYDGNLPVLYRDIFPNPDEDNFFFTETSYRSSLSSKTLCSVESYCRLHPNATLWMTLTSPSLDEKTILELEELQKMCTLHYVATDVFLTLANTPLEDLPNSFGFWRSRILYYNLSDLMRLAMVYKSGGVYSDTDLVATQPITNRRNFLASNGLEIGNSVFHFDAGHPYVYDLMHYIKNHFYRDIFTMSGPAPVSYVIQQRCPKVSKHVKPTVLHQLPDLIKIYAQEYVKEKEDPCKPYKFIENIPKSQFDCKGVDVLEAVAFFGVHWLNWKTIFYEPPEKTCLKKLIQNSYGIHLTGSRTFGSNAAQGSGLATLASLKCPRQFEVTGGNLFTNH